MGTPTNFAMEAFHLAVQSGEIERAEGLLSAMPLKDRVIAALQLLSNVDFGGAK